MRAAVLTKLGAPLEIFDGISVPNLGVGQVLVKIAYSGVCHSQVMEAKGGRGHDRWLPHMLGHEATGRVISTGSGVTKVVTGDLVVLGWIKGQGCEAGGCQYICDELKRRGGSVSPDSKEFGTLIDGFSEALCGRGDARWQAYFLVMTCEGIVDDALGE